MARQGIFTGSSPNDGTGDSLLVGASKVNQNFSEIYSVFGNGNTLVSYASSSGISTVSQGLTGTPNITVNRIVAGLTSSVIPFLWQNYADLPSFSSYHGAFAHVHETGKAYYAHTRWVELVNTETDRTVGTGTENYKVGVITATSFVGDGSQLTGIGTNSGGSGIALTSLSVTVNAVGLSTLSYNNSTGVFAFTPPNLTGYATTGSIVGFITAGALTGYATTGSIVGFITSGALTGYATTGSIVGFITAGALTGYATTGSIVGFITAGALAGYATTGSIVGFITAGALTGYATTGNLTALTINDLADVNAGGPSTGQVLKWSGTEWNAASDLTAAGGSGIGLTDLSVTVNAVGLSTLSYNNSTGVFAFTPPNLTGYATTGSIVGFITAGDLTGYATTGSIVGFITSGALTGYATTGSIVGFITAGALAGAGGTWSTNAAGIHTSKNVGIGTTLSSSALTVEGDGRFSGIVTATRFESVSAGTPTINSPNNLNINAVLVAISTDVTIGDELRIAGITTIGPGGIRVAGVVTATSFIGDGSALTGIVGGSSGIVIKDSGSTVGTAGTIDFGDNLSVSAISAGIVTVTGSAGGGSSQFVTTAAGIHTLSNVGIGTTNPTSALTVSGDVSTSSLRGYSSLVGTASSAITSFVVTVASKTSNHRYFGTGSGSAYFIDGIESPFLTLLPGKTYRFTQDDGSNGSHQLLFYYTADRTTQYTTNVTTNGSAGSAGAYTQIVVTDTTPVVLHYQCINHGYMGNAANFSSNVVDTPYQITARSGINVTGVVTATSFVGSLTGTATSTTNIPNLTGAITSVNTTTSLGSFTSANLATALTDETGSGSAVFATSPTFVTPALGTPSSGNLTNCTFPTLNQNTSGTAGGLTGTPNITVGVATATSFRSNSTTGNGTDVGFAIRYYVTASGSSSYRFAGPGVVNTTNNPTFYLHRGFTYIFENSTGGSHPFAIRYSSGGTGYGSTYLSGSQTGTQVFTVPFDAPATLVYQCTAHGGMLGTFNIVT